MLKKKIPVLYLVLSTILASALTFYLIYSKKNTPETEEKVVANTATVNSATIDRAYNIKTFNPGYKYINPIIAVESVNESEQYIPLRESISGYIKAQKQDGLLLSASVYFKSFANGNWMAVNAKERYDPGSLVKVGVLMTYLRMADADNTLLNKEVVYHGRNGFVFPKEHYNSDTVLEGHKYKISELLDYMIRYSDNRATLFLENHMDTITFKKIFTDLDITEPRFEFPSFMLNVREYSMMFSALYNAGYLQKHASEYALGLLTQSNFKNGLLKELPESVTAAHKFGEQGDDHVHELHESGIIYINNHPYLITVMTKGTDWDKLSEVTGHISRIVYDNMTAHQ